MPATAAPAVQLTGITKRFPGVVANRDVNLTVTGGEVHAIVGENGCGKSTLMKTLYGMHRPDEGTIAVNGHTVSFKSPKDAIAAGIGMVHQHFQLADNLTVLENIILGAEPAKRGRIDTAAARKRISALGDTYGVPIDADRMTEELSIGERQLVEIIKVLYRGARILILDEPTSALVPHEVDELFRNIRDLTAQGVTVLFISHKLNEVLEIADTITVLRRGETVGSVKPSEVDAHQLAELMVGSELPSPATTESTVRPEVMLSVKGVGVRASADAEGGLGAATMARATVAKEAARWACRDVSLDVRCGEIVGIAGVKGNGQEELIEALVGLHDADEGAFVLDGMDITHASTRRRREAGVAYIPEDRQRQGLLLPSPLWENEMLGHQTQPPNAMGPGFAWIDRGGARARTKEIIDEYDVRTPGIDVAAYALSGGNQQKLIIGREMASQPKLLVAAHPTLGIDVGAQAAVWDELRKARINGLAVVLISADLDELIGLSDTLYVMYSGRLTARLDPATITPKELGSYMTGTEQGSDR